MSQNDTKFENHVSRLFQAQCANTDPAARLKLRNARRSALESLQEHTPWQWWVPAGATAAMLAAAIFVPWKAQPVLDEDVMISAAQSAKVNADLINEDPEFYLWLASAPVASETDESTEELL